MRPKGVLDTQTTGYKETVQTLVEQGIVKKNDAATGLMLLDLMASRPKDGGPKVLHVPLEARDGDLFVGAIKVLRLAPLAPPQ